MTRTTVTWLLPLLLLNASLLRAQESSSAYHFLKDLEVFSGSWEGTTELPADTPESERLGQVGGKQVKLLETCRWAPGKCAQISEISYMIDGSETILGTTLIGWDQKSEQITMKEFTTHKGVWSGTIEKDGGKWVFAFEGYNLDGKKCTGKRVVTFTDADHYTSIETDRTQDGEPLPDATWHFRRL